MTNSAGVAQDGQQARLVAKRSIETRLLDWNRSAGNDCECRLDFVARGKCVREQRFFCPSAWSETIRACLWKAFNEANSISQITLREPLSICLDEMAAIF